MLGAPDLGSLIKCLFLSGVGGNFSPASGHQTSRVEKELQKIYFLNEESIPFLSGARISFPNEIVGC